MYNFIPWECKNRIWLLHKRIVSGCKHERSVFIVAQRTVYEGVIEEGGPTKEGFFGRK